MWLLDGARDRSSAEGGPSAPARHAPGATVVANTNRGPRRVAGAKRST